MPPRGGLLGVLLGAFAGVVEFFLEVVVIAHEGGHVAAALSVGHTIASFDRCASIRLFS